MRPASAELHPVSAPASVDPAEHPASIASTSQVTSPEHPLRWWLPVWLVLVGVGVFVACFGIVGADCYWLVALGRWIIAHGRIPDGVPFAAAPTSGWPNPLVLAELLFTAFAAVGPQGLLAAQVVADLGALALLAVGARREGAGGTRTALALALVFVGSLAPLVVIRLQLLSLIPFAALLLLLRSEHRRPSWRIWLIVPLCALWSNLHGAVLMGLAVAGCYLLFSRLRLEPLRAVVVGTLTVGALFLTPALSRTGHYYYGVFNNEAAKQGTDLWAAPSFSSVFDLIMMGAGLVLLVSFLRRRRPLWEYVAVVGLVAATATSARHGIWLLFFLAASAAARARTRSTAPTRSTSEDLSMPLCRHPAAGWGLKRLRATGVGALVLVLALTPVLFRSPSSVTRHPPGLVEAVKSAAQGRVVLAEEPLAEELAANGVRVWASDPIDAFEVTEQKQFLEFTAKPREMGPVVPAAPVIVLRSAGDETLPGRNIGAMWLARTLKGWSIYASGH